MSAWPHAFARQLSRPLSLAASRAAAGIGLGEDAGDRAAQHPHAHPVGDVDLDLLRAHHPGDGAEDAAAGHDPVAAPQRVEHRPMILRFFCCGRISRK